MKTGMKFFYEIDFTDKKRVKEHKLEKRYICRHRGGFGFHTYIHGLFADSGTSACIRSVWFTAPYPHIRFSYHIQTVCGRCGCHACSHGGRAARADRDSVRVKGGYGPCAFDRSAYRFMVFRPFCLKGGQDSQVYINPGYGRFYIRCRDDDNTDADT